MNDLLLDSLIFRERYSTFLKWDSGGYFIAGTRDNNCPRDTRGAAYAILHTTIERYRFISWDREFAASGEQVWVGGNGPYSFIKMPRNSADLRTIYKRLLSGN